MRLICSVFNFMIKTCVCLLKLDDCGRIELGTKKGHLYLTTVMPYGESHDLVFVI